MINVILNNLVPLLESTVCQLIISAIVLRLKEETSSSRETIKTYIIPTAMNKRKGKKRRKMKDLPFGHKV